MSTADFQARQFELLLPHEIRAALAARPVVYVPLGTYEWHGEHLPIGLDALTAHGICLRTAAADGGIVCPPLYYGIGGGHAAYPWTVMMESEAEITAILHKTLTRLQDFGVHLAVLFSGHFATQQLAMIAAVAESWNSPGKAMDVLALGVNMAEGVPMAPDHAALFETTLLGALWPDRVQLGRLPPPRNAEPGEIEEDPFGPQRHDPAHPLHGIFGPDPRRYDPRQAEHTLAAIVRWTAAQVGQRISAPAPSGCAD